MKLLFILGDSPEDKIGRVLCKILRHYAQNYEKVKAISYNRDSVVLKNMCNGMHVTYTYSKSKPRLPSRVFDFTNSYKGGCKKVYDCTKYF